jgi:hypothetical protein
VELEWCDTIASCFSTYTAIPSVPKESALAQVRLPRWVSVNLTFIIILASALLIIRDLKNDDPPMSDYDFTADDDDSNYGDGEQVFFHRSKNCHGQKTFDKVVFCVGNLYTIVSLGYWWTSYAKEPALVSIGGLFFATWQLTNTTHFHPLQCLLDRWAKQSSTARRIIQGFLYVAAASQCIATFAMIKGAGESLNPCLESKVQPTSTCPVTEFCSKVHLFADPGYGLRGDLLSTFHCFVGAAGAVTASRIVLQTLNFLDTDPSCWRCFRIIPLAVGVQVCIISGSMVVDN